MDFVESAVFAIRFHLARYWRNWLLLSVPVMAVLVLGYVAITPPALFPQDTVVIIGQGSARAAATKLGELQVVAHPELLWLLLRVSGTGESIHSGAYAFKTPENLIQVAYRLAVGEFGTTPLRLTFPEGETTAQIAKRVAKALPHISQSDFIDAARGHEGYLFPDTYVFLPDATAESIVSTMQENFATRTAQLTPLIAASGHSLSEIVILASIIEKEVRGEPDRQMVSGILWKRLSIGMRLQVDAEPWTYDHAGLPPAPIANPGLDALIAAATPIKSKYLFYLSGRDGTTHYASTFEGHKANRAKYLD